MINRIIILASILIIKSSNVLAYHTSQHSGGASLPTYETSFENTLYLLIPFFIFTLFLNQLMQTYLERRYQNETFKEAEDYLQYTLAGSVFIVFLTLFTSLFHRLPQISTSTYAALMTGLLVVTLLLKEKERIMEKIQ